ncbi:ABC transporter ATP-binding protein, partial [Verrucomicrobiota bacterium]
VYFRTRTEPIRAVDGVNLTIHEGRTAALVGESGCGKTVTALSFARLITQPGYVAGGRISFGGRDVLSMDTASLRHLRGAEISYIFQEPATSLNPVFRVGYQIAEAIRMHRKGVSVRKEVMQLMKRVGLPEHRVRAYPQELSGGMQQRVMIAMALACRPKLLVADEPTTALDVTIQAQILDLLVGLQQELGMAVLLITHNMGLVADVAHRVYVMYAGRIVESAPTEELLTSPAHPYTLGLLAAVPRLSDSNERVTGIQGSVPNPARLPTGCKFHPRCPRAQERCRQEEPELTEISHVGTESAKWSLAAERRRERQTTDDGNQESQHGVRCHFWK